MLQLNDTVRILAGRFRGRLGQVIHIDQVITVALAGTRTTFPRTVLAKV